MKSSIHLLSWSNLDPYPAVKKVLPILASQQKLQRLIAPFLMRRLKKEVAKDLPEKVEQVPLSRLGPMVPGW